MNYRKKVVLMLGVLSYLNLGTFSQAAPLTVDHTSVAGVQQASNDKKTIKISGSVRDAAGESIIGATILEKGTSNGVVSDMDGNFSMTVAANGILHISYIGYVDQDIAVAGKSLFNIQLLEDTEMLDEVVVIGYGTVKRRDLTGAIASVKGDEVAANPVSNVAQALQGRLPGVNVVSQDGRPGATISVRVRGGGSITQSNDPLYVVDGFPVSNIGDIPASEIESIDVLKDASSTAIYGARGANGVILVTTKSAKEGQIKVSYDGYVQVKNVSKTLETLSAQEYILHNWSYAASRGTANQDAVEKYFGLGSKYGNHYADYANVKAHDYTDDVLRTALSHNHSVNVSGGTDKTKVIFTLGYVNDEGIKINSDYNRLNASFKIRQKLAKTLDLDVDFRYTESNLNGRENVTNGKGSNVSGAYRYRPIDNPLGGVSYSEVASGFSFGVANIDDKHNPVELINDITNKSYSRSLRGSAALSWEIIKGLVARSELSLTRSSSKSTYYENGYTNGDKRATLNRGMGDGLRSVSTLNYNFNIGKNNVFSALLGNEVLKSDSESSQITGRGYPSTFDYDTTMGLIHTATTSFSATNSYSVPARTVSFFGRLSYTFMDRYLFTGTFRADGSSKFAPDNRWGYFPAGAFAWRLSEEPFMNGTKDWLSNLKLRLSYGTSGSDNISSNLWRETWSSLGSGSNHTPINGELGSFYRPDGLLANSKLKWETTISRNIGLDFGFFNNRLSGTIDAYWNTTKDLLMCIPIDETTGYSYQYQNIGQTSNKGIEIALNYDILRTKDFTLGVSATYNYNHNNIDELADNIIAQYGSQWASSATTPTYDYEFREGKPVGLIRGYICDGYYTTADFNYDPATKTYTLKPGVADLGNQVGNYPSHYNLPEGQKAFPGAVKLRDLDGNGVADTEDVADLGEITHPHTGGFNLNMTWKDIDFSAGFAWAAGGHVYNVNSLINMYGNKDTGAGANKLEFISDCYQIYDIQNGELVPVVEPDALDALNTGAKYGVPYMENGTVLSTFVEDASFLRLNTLTVGYTFPKAWTKKIGMQRARVYATAGNLFTITGYSGIDPEVNADPNKSTTAANTGNYPLLGMDYGTYPRARTFTFGVNITF